MVYNRCKYKLKSWYLGIALMSLFDFCHLEGNPNPYFGDKLNQEQVSRNYYPANYKRFRRGYGMRDEHFSSYGNNDGPPADSFGKFRGGGARNSPQRSFSSKTFPGYSGPDAFLSAAPNDEENYESQNFGGGNNGFQSFSSSSGSWGEKMSNKGRSKGGIKTFSAGQISQPQAINFGKENSMSSRRGTSKFSIGGIGGRGSSSGSSSYETSKGSSHGSSSKFEKKGSYFSSFGHSQSYKKPTFSSSSSKNTFSSVHEGFPNPFLNPAGEYGSQYSHNKESQISGTKHSFGNLGSYTGKIEDLTDGNILGPLKNMKNLGNIDINALLEQLEPVTTTKKPRRKISDEDKDKIFSGGFDGEKDTEETDSLFSSMFGEKEKRKFKMLDFSKGSITSAKYDSNQDCAPPEAPLNAEVRCTPTSGCRIDCNSNYQTVYGDKRLYLMCVDGKWTVKGKESREIPNCEPICDPPCQNEGFCLAPNLCNCPDNWDGPICEDSKAKKCSMKPPTPLNTKIYCGKDECNAKCIDGYVFENGNDKLTFVCDDGEWVVQGSNVNDSPNCRATCDPECQNGGICLAPDLCECSNEFRGPHCQYPISNCDAKKLGFNGGYNCTGKNMDYGCRLWCPKGVEFTSPAADFYTCDFTTGKWSPSPVPMCNYKYTGVKDHFSSKLIYNKTVHYEATTTTTTITGGTCFTWSGLHYKSFDGRVYSFKSGCPYTLLQDASLGTFSVNLVPEEGCQGPNCGKSLKIFTEGDQYVLGRSDGHPVLTYRDTSLAIPGQMNGLVSERVAHYVVVKLTGIGLTLKWDLENLFEAEVSELLWNRTSGLCGKLDGSDLNEWGYQSESYDAGLSNFLKTWQATTIGAPCLELPIIKSSCSSMEKMKAKSFCGRLSEDPSFELCTQIVDVRSYIEACIWDYCDCNNEQNRETCSCNSFDAFFKECTNRGMSVPGGWRSQELCPMQCKDGLIYKSCMPAIRSRCGQAAEMAEPDFCVEGCDCPEGLVLEDDGVCIRAEDCPCTYHNKTYSSGDVIPNDCNTCTCMAGEWMCTEVKCGARCASVGDPHYTTFDGRKYDFMGKCSYYLVKGADFSIEAENTACAGAITEAMNFPASVISQFPSCTRSLTLRVPGTTVHLKQGGEVTINGEEITVLPLWANNVFVKKACSLFLTVYLPNGIEVWWDGQTRAYVDAPPELRGQTSGLCGTFNDNQKDDFLTPEGDNEQDPRAFANKWKTSQKCPDVLLSEEAHPCDRHAQNKEVAEKYCAKIKSELFSDCHLEVDPETFYRDCLYDMCSCEAELKNCVCPVLAAYGKECARKGILVDWRANIRECGLHCTGGQKYQICGNSCSRTCYDLATNPECRSKCAEGCNCPEGFALDVNEVCVPISDCPCVYKGQEFKPNYEMYQKNSEGKTEICICENTQWNCRAPTQVEQDSPEFFTEPQVDCLKEENMVYSDCLPDEEPTCQTMHLRPEKQTDICRPGCRCEVGYVRNPDTNKCIPYAECPCHHGGKSYQEGETMIEECNTCVCVEGLWSCSEDPCPAICTAWGDSHYKTFDGRVFDFHGTCDYMLAKGKKSRSDMFEVSIQNVPCGTNGVTCAKSLTLRIGKGENQEVVQFSRNKPPPLKNMTRTIIREAGVFVFAEVADMGLELQWDRGTRAYVILDPSWKGERVQGLCGNYNGDEKDDFRTPSGGTGEVSARLFGDSWRLQNYCAESINIKDTCSLHPHRKVWASEKCAVLKSPLFAPCHSEVPVEPYVERCQFDACGCDTGGDCHCLCTAVATYAQECNIHGVFIKWRKPEFCPMQCDESCERYEPCIPTCPSETCDSYKEPQSTLCRRDSCVEGCAKDVCPPGHVHKSSSDKECVPNMNCEKICLEINGRVFMEGSIISEDNCHTCFCTKGKNICRGTPCQDIIGSNETDTTPYERVTTPAVTHRTRETDKCRSGWTAWINNDHPITYRKNSDIEYLPENVQATSETTGFCSRDMYADIRCRSVGDHNLPVGGITCNLQEGLRCEMPAGSSKGKRNCLDYEISLLCDCSEAPHTTTPIYQNLTSTITLPPIYETSTSTPSTCEINGWTKWYNVHTPNDLGEFETLENIRETEVICPDAYIKDIECQPANEGEGVPSVKCSKKGAICRNNGGIHYCKDYKIRIFCECQCQDGLGMEDGRIPEEAITASSSTSETFGRLNSEAEWIPDFGSEDYLSKEWLQIDLGTIKEMTGVVTQGHSSVNAYIIAFAIQVSEGGDFWVEVRDPGTDHAKRFTGNTNSYEPVVNIFPKPVYGRFIRIIPLEAKFLAALRVEIKGCDIKDNIVLSVTPSSLIHTTPLYEDCQDGWTVWMNSHTPSPRDWDDIENYKSLRQTYPFCDEASIQKIECRVSTLHTSIKEGGQVDVSCNKNIGLQCVDELQRDHCFDYEVRFFCECTLTTLPSTTLETTTSEVPTDQICDPAIPAVPHESLCSMFYECQVIEDDFKLVKKECGSGTLFNPKTFICDWPPAVLDIRPECEAPSDPLPSCTDDYWTEWFNISHPSEDGGDYELIQEIRNDGLNICDQKYVIDIQCQYYLKKDAEPTHSKGASKGKKSHKGRPKPDRYTSVVADYSTSDDVSVSCSTNEGLICKNTQQRGLVCKDYAIRVLCSCESMKTSSTISTTSTVVPSTTPFLNYTDIRTLIPTPMDVMMGDEACPNGKYYKKYAIKCTRICLFYRHYLVEQGQCLDDEETAPACVDEVTGSACPPGYFLRDKSSCVHIYDCNCVLPNGMSAPPDRKFLVANCEICKCSENELICDNSRCYDRPEEFGCDEWSPWMSVSAPSGAGDIETMDILTRYHPELCFEPEEIECRVKESGLLHFITGQKVICDVKTGFQCLNKNNPSGCKDYEVRVFCKCSSVVPTTVSTYEKPTSRPLPPLPGCTEPYWTEWFNVTHPHIRGGDYELIDVLIKDGLDICPKAYISDIQCSYYKEFEIQGKYRKGRPVSSTINYELTDYTESNDLYVTCSKFSGLTCVNCLQAKSKKCEDYAIRVLCNCDDSVSTTEKVTLPTPLTTTPYPGWPIIGPECEEDEGTVRVECAIECKKTCLFYRHYLQLGGECQEEMDCAPACMELSKKSVCPDGLYMSDNSTCVGIADCVCRLPNGQPLPGGMKVQASECEWCECIENLLYCETTPGCFEPPTEPTLVTSFIPTAVMTPATTSRYTTQPPQSLIRIRCNDWTPWMNMKRTAEGDFQRIVDLRAQYEELCEVPANISCRDSIAKLSAEELDQVITCSTTEGFICWNINNREDCYDYEVSMFCECPEGHTEEALPTTTPAPVVTTTLVPCDGYSPWINEHSPWLEDGDTEFKTLEQLRDKYSFCTEGHISSIECFEASSGMDISVNKGVRCDPDYGLRCKNEDQETRVCYDFKIRYYCTCGTTIATRPTMIVPSTPTPPSVCEPSKYVKLLENLDDSRFSATSSLNPSFGPASARMKPIQTNGGAWMPKTSDKKQFLQVDLGELKTIYGFESSGSSRIKDRVTSYSIQISDDELLWSPAPSEIFQGPAKSNEVKSVLLKNPVEGRYVRFLPNSWIGSIAARFDILGCRQPSHYYSTISIPTCNEEMGLENGNFSTDQLTVSSVLNDMHHYYGKQNVRLNTEEISGVTSGAWIAKPSPNEYIRFDFLRPSKLTGILTQGRPQKDEYVESYIVRYSPDDQTWSEILDSKTGKVQIFRANYDSSTPIENSFERILEARYLEIRPQAWNGNIALRVEVKGCFYPYPKITTTPAPSTTTVKPPPPHCNACPNLPSDYHEKCIACPQNLVFDGDKCIPEILCPCYHEGSKYELGTLFENKDCETCECEENGEITCKSKQCESCSEENERPVQTASCRCVCKPCQEKTKLCKSNNFCLDEEKWCDGIEQCPDDELNCPTKPPAECPVPDCPEEWTLLLEQESDGINCPQYRCEPPDLTTPMSCPAPLCPFGYNIILVPKRPYEVCPRYECEEPAPTWEPFTCPPPTCTDGYDMEIVPMSYDQQSSQQQSFGQSSSDYEEYDEADNCPQYKCVTNVPPTAPCPLPKCPEGYDITYPSAQDMIELCPVYECVPIVTPTPCPPVECPKGLQTLVVRNEGNSCTQYTCVKVTTAAPYTTTPAALLQCAEISLPVCEPGEEIYQANPHEPCPIFKCKIIGSVTSTTGLPMIYKPICQIKNKEFKTFDGAEFRIETCHHILARDKIQEEWQISIHSNCTKEPCVKYLKIKDNKNFVVINHKLKILWNNHTYTTAQAQMIGETSGSFSLSKVGDALIYKSLIYSFIVLWNVETDMKIEISEGDKYQVDGLCGLYSGSNVDDRTKPDGSLATSTKEFADAWALTQDGTCEDLVKKCSIEDSKKAFLLCNALESKPFTECHDVLPVTTYLKGCVDRLCVCLKENKTEEECKCGVLASYITACLEKKPHAKIADWRIVTKCYKECPQGEVYNDCFKSSCEKSCENMKTSEKCSDEEQESCISGCFCEPGLVRKGDTCVLPEHCRDCVCDGYGDPHYKTFDRKNFTFNGECSYVAARDVDPKGEHKFQVITRNKQCQQEPITMCTENVKILYNNHEINIGLLDTDALVTSINDAEIINYPFKEPWVTIEKPCSNSIALVIPEIQLEVTFSKDNHGFGIRLPSHLFYNKLEGLCGNCNFNRNDDLKSRNGIIETSVKDFGLSWLTEDNDKEKCKVHSKEDMPCVPASPDEDLCLRLMDHSIFGECHPLQNPVSYISSCQLDSCHASDAKNSACQSIEAYARRCSQLGICLNWRSDELCPIECPAGLVYLSCGPGCIKTCDNYENLKKNPNSCLISPVDGCYCKDNMILDNGTCVTESQCITCDSAGHRVGEVWRTDSCTTCQCEEGGVATCKSKLCPIVPVCEEFYILEEIPETGDDCCGPQNTCKIRPLDNCTEPVKPTEDCGYGKKFKLLETPGVCPEYVCICVELHDCPELQTPDETDLKPGEQWNLESKGCCPRYVPKCVGECPQPECDEFLVANLKPLNEGQCCPEYSCEPPLDACIYQPQMVVEDGYARPYEDEEALDKHLHKIDETWFDGFCIECTCVRDSSNKYPDSKCMRKTCTSVEEHQDRKDYVLEQKLIPDTCCSRIVRTACIENGEIFEVNNTLNDPLNACRSVECKDKAGKMLEKVELMFSCDENCKLGYNYIPNPEFPHTCCGECEQIACVDNGNLREVGDIWYSEDMCTIYECIRDNNYKIQTLSKEIQCQTPSVNELKIYKYKESKQEGQCCFKYTKESCLIGDNIIEVGQEVTDPADKCIKILCESSSDGNVTRREKEQACLLDCALGHIYRTPPPESDKCCGDCLQTQCVDDDKIYSIGETWENPDDICYQYNCQMRDDVLTIVAIKRECPYFDPECPPEETLQDATGCCKLCNVTREAKRECQPEEIDPKETIDMFVLEARTVGRCANLDPVYGFNRCSGQCNSKTVFKAKGIEARHESVCNCCKPSKTSQIEVPLKCTLGYEFKRVYENIDACECQPCESSINQYQNDQPMQDLTEFNIPANNVDAIKS